ncbi:hypothetical protein PInf_010389 [Phytophthora infestans]|nr:hypothetical protein PInf_010389 [Phytophthora infestans]
MSSLNWNDPIEDEEQRLAWILADADEDQIADAPAAEGEGGEVDPRTHGESGETAEVRTERAVEGPRERAAQEDDESLFGASPRAEENRRMFMTMLGTPQGRASFQAFLGTLADRQTHREEQTRSREARETETAGSGTRRGVSFSLDPSRPPLTHIDETGREAPSATTAEYSREEDVGRLTTDFQAEPLSGMERPWASSATLPVPTTTVRRETTPASPNATPASHGTTPTSHGTTPTSEGTATVDPALQAFIVNTIGQAMQQMAMSSVSTDCWGPRGVEPVVPGEEKTVYRSNPEARTGGPSSPIPLYEKASDRAPRTYEGSGAYDTPRQYSSSNPFGPMLPPGWNPIEMPPTYPFTPMTTPSMPAGTRPERTLNWGTKPTDERSFQSHEGDPRLRGNVGFDRERYPRYATPHPAALMAQYAGREPHDYGRGLAPMVGIPNELRNAVKVIVPLYSVTASSERAAAFWRSFEKFTMCMDDQLRLTAFEQCLKGKKGQEWWYNSRIHSFESLRSRFHNRFVCLTPAQTWPRLKTATRKRGESAEEWGDRLETICDALNLPEPRMRYEFFLEGIRNKQMRAVLNGNMIGSIEQACRILLFKNLHLPIEEDDEFPEDGMKPLGTKNVPSTELQPGHGVTNCPEIEKLRSLSRNAVAGGTTAAQGGKREGKEVSLFPLARLETQKEMKVHSEVDLMDLRGPPRAQNADQGTAERPEDALKTQEECNGKAEADELSDKYTRAEQALETKTENVVGVRTYLFAAVIGVVDAPEEGVKVPEAELNTERTKATDSSNDYDRLFTDEELDMLEGGEDRIVKSEPEEYDKELEERLLSLDDEKIQSRVTQNASKQEKPSLAELSEQLGIPEEVLERTREVSTGEMREPEYWLDWYERTLENSAAARRANRNFKDETGTTETASPVGAITQEENGDSASEDDSAESEFIRNVCVGVDESPTVIDGAEEGVPLPFRWRSEIRKRVYDMLKLGRDEYGKNEKGETDPTEGSGTRADVPPLRDKTEKNVLDEESLRDHLAKVGGATAPSFLNRAVTWARSYFRTEASTIRDKLRDKPKASKIDGPVPDVVALNRLKEGTFGFPIQARDQKRLKIADEQSDIYAIYARRVPRPRRSPGLRAVSEDDASQDGVGAVPEEKRVICSVGGLKAVTGGFIDCCPSEMLADTGAVASLVNRRVLKRLGRASEPLKPYTGSLDSVSGHEIRVRGVVELPITLGTIDMTLPFVVVDHLFVDAILGTDSLRSFRAVIDLEDQTMTLKGTGDVIPLGISRVEETYAVTTTSAVRL